MRKSQLIAAIEEKRGGAAGEGSGKMSGFVQNCKLHQHCIFYGHPLSPSGIRSAARVAPSPSTNVLLCGEGLEEESDEPGCLW